QGEHDFAARFGRRAVSGAIRRWYVQAGTYSGSACRCVVILNLRKGLTIMDNIHKLDAVADRESTVPTGRQESKVSRSPWQKPVIRRSDIAQYTSGRARAAYDDGAISGGYS